MEALTVYMIYFNIFIILLLVACATTRSTGGVYDDIRDFAQSLWKPFSEVHVPQPRALQNRPIRAAGGKTLNDMETVPQKPVPEMARTPIEVMDTVNYGTEFSHPEKDYRDRPQTSFSSEVINPQFRTPIKNCKGNCKAGCGVKGPSRETVRDPAF
jgi:hypothetical protein